MTRWLKTKGSAILLASDTTRGSCERKLIFVQCVFTTTLNLGVMTISRNRSTVPTDDYFFGTPRRSTCDRSRFCLSENICDVSSLVWTVRVAFCDGRTVPWVD